MIFRASTQNSQRSLPEIPHVVGRHDSGDTASDTYATVNIDLGKSFTYNLLNMGYLMQKILIKLDWLPEISAFKL